jgi:hypothetical protein
VLHPAVAIRVVREDDGQVAIALDRAVVHRREEPERMALRKAEHRAHPHEAAPPKVEHVAVGARAHVGGVPPDGRVVDAEDDVLRIDRRAAAPPAQQRAAAHQRAAAVDRLEHGRVREHGARAGTRVVALHAHQPRRIHRHADAVRPAALRARRAPSAVIADVL